MEKCSTKRNVTEKLRAVPCVLCLCVGVCVCVCLCVFVCVCVCFVKWSCTE